MQVAQKSGGGGQRPARGQNRGRGLQQALGRGQQRGHQQGKQKKTITQRHEGYGGSCKVRPDPRQGLVSPALLQSRCRRRSLAAGGNAHICASAGLAAVGNPRV